MVRSAPWRRATSLERALGVRLRDRRLLAQALTHRSYAYEQGGLPTNERLEFLGDAVLGLVVTDALYREFPEQPEGELAKQRAALVNMTVLADVAREVGLGDHVLVGRGEELTGGRDKPSILADTLEAVLGAVYLDRGMRPVRRVIRRLFLGRVRGEVEGGVVVDYKTALQELAASRFGALPEYQVAESGPDHAKRFTARVVVEGHEYGTGDGRSKKEAEQAAARIAIGQLSEERPGPGRDRRARDRKGR